MLTCAKLREILVLPEVKFKVIVLLSHFPEGTAFGGIFNTFERTVFKKKHCEIKFELHTEEKVAIIVMYYFNSIVFIQTVKNCYMSHNYLYKANRVHYVQHFAP